MVWKIVNNAPADWLYSRSFFHPLLPTSYSLCKTEKSVQCDKSNSKIAFLSVLLIETLLWTILLCFYECYWIFNAFWEVLLIGFEAVVNRFIAVCMCFNACYCFLIFWWVLSIELWHGFILFCCILHYCVLICLDVIVNGLLYGELQEYVDWVSFIYFAAFSMINKAVKPVIFWNNIAFKIQFLSLFSF